MAPISVMALHAPGDRLLLLRNSLGADGVSWVEDLDPLTLEPMARSPELDLGPFWPGGFAVLDDGAVVVVQGCWAHRLRPDLSVEVARRLPVDAPHNSFVVLDDGTLATKDLQRPGGAASTLSILDPVTLDDVVAPRPLPEPSVARLSADGSTIVVVGVCALHIGEHEPVPYLLHPDQSFGWDPVVDDGTIWWLDNGDHRFEQGLTMLDAGVATGPVRLWKWDGASLASVEICGAPGGAVTNPPLVDPSRGVVVGYDSANGVMAAFSTDDLSPRWQTTLRTATHLVLYPDTGELVANDHDRAAGDALVVVDIATGAVRARVPVHSPAQSVVFGAPGTRRDFYYVSLSTITRVVFD